MRLNGSNGRTDQTELTDVTDKTMRQLLPGIWQWSWFSDEKQLDFNGLFLTVGEHRILVDPPPMKPEDVLQIRKGGRVDYILITNRDHLREAVAYKAEFACQLWLPEIDAPQMDVKPDKTYKDGELLSGGIWAVHLQHQKSPGECALFIQQGKGVLIVGDALIGKPRGSVSMLPREKYADPVKARDGLRRLLKYNFDTLLVGDGASILSDAKPVVETVLNT
jgi:glyoxylase-like metal-dependent hydrolase (beta-lactamase superfamily II)